MLTKFRMLEVKPEANPPGLHVDCIRIVREIDECPDLSYLGDGDPEYADQDAARLRAYGSEWWCYGIYAEALVSYPVGRTDRRVSYFNSSGLWGIESDSESNYFNEVAREEIDNLRNHLREFAVPVDDDTEWERLATDAMARREW